MSDREKLVFDASNAVIDKFVWSLPINIKNIYNILNIKILPLSWYLCVGMREDEVYAVWGNRDGAASKMGAEYAVGFNDIKVSENRARFTLCEELMHILLGHTDDPSFDAFRRVQPDRYAQYESEAKTAAGLILLPGQLWLRHRHASIHSIANVCGISDACAFTTIRWYEEHEDLIRSAATHKNIVYNMDALREKRRGRIVQKSSEN